VREFTTQNLANEAFGPARRVTKTQRVKTLQKKMKNTFVFDFSLFVFIYSIVFCCFVVFTLSFLPFRPDRGMGLCNGEEVGCEAVHSSGEKVGAVDESIQSSRAR